MNIKPVTHCSPYLTQAQTRRLLLLLEANPRKADASLRKKLKECLRKAADDDLQHAQWLLSRANGGEAS